MRLRLIRLISTQTPNIPGPEALIKLPSFLEFYRPVIESTEHIIENIVHFTGMPWWFSIGVLTIGIRVINLPLLFLQYRAMSPLAKVIPNYRLLNELLKNAEISKANRLITLLTSVRKINKEHNIKFSKAFAYGLFQLPQFLTFIWGIRSLCVRNPDLVTGGTAWFVDLSQSDPYMILPLCSLGLTYMNLQRGITPENKDWLINRFKNFIQVWLIVTLPITVQWPSVDGI